MGLTLDLSPFVDWSLLLLRAMVASVFITSGFNHLKDPRGRAASLDLSIGFTVFLGLAEFLGGVAILVGFLTQYAAIGLILIMSGAAYMKISRWKTGFWGEKSQGWHYELMFIVMNLVILCTGGGRIALMHK